MSRKRRLVMESLPHDVVELILEKLPVKSLLPFKAVTKRWKSTVESSFFIEKQLKHRQQLGGDPDVLMVPDREFLITLVLGSSSSDRTRIHFDQKEVKDYIVSYQSCDGLVSFYHPVKSGFVVNPATGWYRPLPLCQLQQRMIDLGGRYANGLNAKYSLGFGKDMVTGVYKAVWLYNTSKKTGGLENATICEVFDFSKNAWRYVTPAAPYGIVGVADPVFVDGSLHWFTNCWREETKIVSFDLHTETFQVVAKTPFAYAHYNHFEIVLCNLDNRLCVSEMIQPNQVIWSFNSCNKTWNKICTIDIHLTRLLYKSPSLRAFRPLALLDGKKKLLFYDISESKTLWTIDSETNSVHVAFSPYFIGHAVCYYPSLISI